MTKNIHRYLSDFGIKPSVQRLAIMEYLMTHRTHPTADEIFQALSPEIPTLSKTTVYNTLRLFAEQGAALALDMDARNLHYDGDITPHAHFFCRRCGTIIDLPMPTEGALQRELPEGVTVDEVQIYYKGVCSKCQHGVD